MILSRKLPRSVGGKRILNPSEDLFCEKLTLFFPASFLFFVMDVCLLCAWRLLVEKLRDFSLSLSHIITLAFDVLLIFVFIILERFEPLSFAMIICHFTTTTLSTIARASGTAHTSIYRRPASGGDDVFFCSCTDLSPPPPPVLDVP